MMRSGFVLIGLLVAGALWAEETPGRVADKITLVVSTDAPGHITRDRLARVYWELIRGQELERQTAPKITVLHVSRKGAANAGMVASGVNTDDLGFYQLWLVGKPEASIYVRGIGTIVRHAFGLPPALPEFQALMQRLIRVEASTVDVRELAD